LTPSTTPSPAVSISSPPFTKEPDPTPTVTAEPPKCAAPAPGQPCVTTATPTGAPICIPGGNCFDVSQLSDNGNGDFPGIDLPEPPGVPYTKIVKNSLPNTVPDNTWINAGGAGPMAGMHGFLLR
jgi:hypothetical protein